jgi:hypothetical protein
MSPQFSLNLRTILPPKNPRGTLPLHSLTDSVKITQEGSVETKHTEIRRCFSVWKWCNKVFKKQSWRSLSRKRWYLLMRTHGVTTQKNNIIIFTTVRSSDLTRFTGFKVTVICDVSDISSACILLRQRLSFSLMNSFKFLVKGDRTFNK